MLYVKLCHFTTILPDPAMEYCFKISTLMIMGLGSMPSGGSFLIEINAHCFSFM